MLFLVLFIGVLNLALGYLAAAALVEPPLLAVWPTRWPALRFGVLWRWPARSIPRPTTGSLATALRLTEAVVSDAARAPIDSESSGPATIAGLDELPEQWLEQLAAEGIVARSFVEGAAHVLRLEVGLYREHLIAAENRGRALSATADGGGLKLLADDLRFINQDWLEKQTTAAGMLSQRAGRLGDHEAAAESLEQVLLDQAAELRWHCAALEALDARAEAETGGKQLLEQLAALVDHAHALRDGMLELLATLLRTGQRLEVLSSACQLDPATGYSNRVGLEVLLAAWWREDPQRARPLSAILIDIDRFARVNLRLGTRSGDRAIVAIGRLLEEAIRKDRGYDRLARVGGESFLTVMGDTGPHEALTAAERLRQTIAATTFDNHGAEFELTLSCGVIEVGRTESVMGLMRRAGEALKYAKKAGRNRCAIDEGSGPTTLEPPQFTVKSRVVKLGEE